MDKIDQKRFSTFLLASGQRLKITPPNGTTWNLIMINVISGSKPVSIINEIPSPGSETPIKNNFLTFNNGDPDCKITNFRLDSKIPFQCYLNKKKCHVQFVFSSNSKEKLLVEQINKEFVSVGCAINPNFPNIFMNEIQRIVKSEHPLNIMSSFFKQYEIRPYFHVHVASFNQILSDSINLALIQMTEKVVSTEISHYINFLDLRLFLGDDLLLHDAIFIEKIINIYPRLKPKVNHIILHTKNFLVFICLLIDKKLFDYSLLFHHFTFPDKVDIMIVFKLLKVIVDEQIPICSSFLNLFSPYVQPPLLHSLLSSNKILYDSTVISKQISNIAVPSNEKITKLEINQPLNFDFNVAEQSNISKGAPKKSNTEKNIASFNPQHFSPQKANQRKKPQISPNPACTFEVIKKNTNQHLKMIHHDHIFLNEQVEVVHRSFSQTPNINEYIHSGKMKSHRERSTKTNNDLIIIASCSLFAIITIIFIWNHFSFYVL
ncbi:hypothetical protein M9Y10_001964 [Tritrichomonas musculus]|uniref:Uncharacterized protein n=1 Tax=Tritrichomonas musculus TaxID=1915356 RepID=A0ABR2L8G8_9EUKA